jgi:hypothetical protein
MSPDEAFVVSILRALQASGLEAIFVGNAAAAMQGAPVTTQDVDLLVRDTEPNRKKIEKFVAALGLPRPVPVSEMTTTQTVLGGPWPIDLLFDRIIGGLEFASLRSRSRNVPIGDLTAVVASLADIIRSKEAANRPKDQAVLPILRDALRVIDALEGK